MSMDKLELEKVYKNARSFPDLAPPNRSYYIGCKKQGNDVYMFWKDESGNYWYETERGTAFKREIIDAQKKRKMASRGNWMPG